MLIFGSIIVIFDICFLCLYLLLRSNPLIINYYATTKKNVFFLLLFVGLSLYAQQNCFIVRMYGVISTIGGRISAESLRASDDLIFLNVRPNKGRVAFV